MDNEDLILKQLDELSDEIRSVGDHVGDVRVDLAEIKAFQKNHYEKLNNHETRIQGAETKLQTLEVSTSGNKILIGIAGFLAGACVIGAVNYLFTQVIP